MPDLVSTKRTGINIAAQWIQHFVLVAVNLFLVGYAIAKVGDENYGGWTVIVSIIGYTTLLAPGISVALQHYVAAHATRSDKLGLGRTLSSAYVIYGAAAVVALPICLMISRAYPMIFPKVPALAAAECSDALVWVGAGMVLVILNLPVEGVLLGLQKHYYRSITESVSVLVRAAVVVATFAWFGPSLAYLGAAFFGGACSRVVLSLFFLHKVEPGLRFRPALISKTSLRQIMSYAGHSTIWTICTVLIRESGPIITVWMLGSREATYYYVGARLIFSFGGLIASAGSVFVPVTSSLWASRDLVRLRSVLIRGARFSALLSIPGAACAVLFGQAVLRHWVGPGFDTAFSVLVAIAIGRLATWSFVVPEA
ncbi:MAG: oligosaccharide flippase family protein, partial [Candidatus Krumholzibacteriia bacterium]